MCSWYIYASDSWNPRKKNSAILHYFCSLPLVGYLNILITYSIHLFFFSSIEIVWANSANLCFLCILAVLSSLDHRKQLVQNSSILCSLQYSTVFLSLNIETFWTDSADLFSFLGREDSYAPQIAQSVLINWRPWQ